MKLLIGNTFSLTLVRGRRVTVWPCPVEELKARLAGAEVVSFWGHENTRPQAEALLGVSLRPAVPRPAVVLTGEGLPSLGGEVFGECYVVSPEYVPGYRPLPGVEAGPDKITGWHVLRLVWDGPGGQGVGPDRPISQHTQPGD